MKNIFIILLLFAGFINAQPVKHAVPFAVGNDSILTSAQDTVDVRFTTSGLSSAWEPLTQVLCSNDTVYVTTADKSAQNVKYYVLPQETFWTRCDIIEFRIRSTSDTLTSSPVSIGNTDGSATFVLQPVVIGDATLDSIYYSNQFIVK